MRLSQRVVSDLVVAILAKPAFHPFLPRLAALGAQHKRLQPSIRGLAYEVGEELHEFRKPLVIV
jgi:hypothetical protein